MSGCIEHESTSTVSIGYEVQSVLREDGLKRTNRHRAVFEMYWGYRPQVVEHDCDNPRCINIQHLSPGTFASNNASTVKRGRKRRDYQAAFRRLTMDEAREIRRVWRPAGHAEHVPGTNGTGALAKQYGVLVGTIQALIQGRTYREAA